MRPAVVEGLAVGQILEGSVTRIEQTPTLGGDNLARIVDTEGNRYLGAARSLMKSFTTPGGRGPSVGGAPAEYLQRESLRENLLREGDAAFLLRSPVPLEREGAARAAPEQLARPPLVELVELPGHPGGVGLVRVRDRGEIGRLLHRPGGEHRPAGGACCHHVGVVPEDRQRLGGEGRTKGGRHPVSPTGKSAKGVFSYALPSQDKFRNSFLRAALGGWTIRSIAGRRSGLPVNVTSGADFVGNGRSAGQRPDAVPGIDLRPSQQDGGWLADRMERKRAACLRALKKYCLTSARTLFWSMVIRTQR